MREPIIESEIKNNKNDKFVHFNKIIILGEAEVGKSTLISYMINYKDTEYKKELERQNTFDSYDLSSNLVENIDRIVIDFNEDRNLYFNIYETNINNYDFIKMNLDELLIQTECIIIMWDNSNPSSFENIPNLVSTLEYKFKENILQKVPIFIIQNKIDLNPEYEEENKENEEKEFKETLEKFKKENQALIYEEISLLENKNKFYELVCKIYQKMEILENDLSKDIYKVDDWLNNIKFEYPLNPLNIVENIENKKTLNCTLVGNALVGKTSFINYLINNKEIDISPSIEKNQFIFSTKIYNESIFFNINDSKATKDANPLFLSKNTDGILLFFDVTKNETFIEIKKWIDSINNNLGKINENYELFLIGNKIDLISERKVLKSDAKKFAGEKYIKYFECSCLKGINVYEIFYEIAMRSYEKKIENKKDINSIKINQSSNLINKKSKSKKNKCCPNN